LLWPERLAAVRKAATRPSSTDSSHIREFPSNLLTMAAASTGRGVHLRSGWDLVVEKLDLVASVEPAWPRLKYPHPGVAVMV